MDISPLIEVIEAYETETWRLARRKGTKAAVASRKEVALKARELVANNLKEVEA